MTNAALGAGILHPGTSDFTSDVNGGSCRSIIYNYLFPVMFLSN